MPQARNEETLIDSGLTTSHTRAVSHRWLCRVTAGPDMGREISIGARPMVVGAGGDCDFVLQDPKISRHHAELQATGKGVRVVDTKSTNGTYFQSSRITEAVLAEGASVRLGDTTLRLTLAAANTVAPSKRHRMGALVGDSVAMREVFAVLELASRSDATVLVEGESGTGKELSARALHDHSGRAEGPFVVVDCGAIHEQLIDSQLFGHVKGAFTGAIAERKGAFVEASGGTLFLDELGELPLGSQAKLLRALEARTVTPVGSDRPVSVDARVVAATNKDLHRMVEEKSFRFDLFYRLAIVHVRLPPLRERPEDIPPLVRLFYEGRGIDPGPLEGVNLTYLASHNWPGNVRELRNVLERAWVLNGSTPVPFAQLRFDLGHVVLEGELLDATLLDATLLDATLPFKEAKEHWLEAFERRYLAAVFAAHKGNITSAAVHSGINRNHFRKLLIKYNLYDR